MTAYKVNKSQLYNYNSLVYTATSTTNKIFPIYSLAK